MVHIAADSSQRVHIAIIISEVDHAARDCHSLQDVITCRISPLLHKGTTSVLKAVGYPWSRVGREIDVDVSVYDRYRWRRLYNTRGGYSIVRIVAP